MQSSINVSVIYLHSIYLWLYLWLIKQTVKLNAMNTIKLNAKHQDSVIGQILELKNQITYHTENIAPFYSEMQAWEAKEYKSVYDENISRLSELKNMLIENESIFNEILSSYNLTVAVFINKYILN